MLTRGVYYSIMNCKICNKCGAKWLEGQLYWSTGALGTDEDLAGLVCNNLKPGEEEECINEKRGVEGGQTWEYRRGYIEGATAEFERAMKNQNKDFS